MIMMSLGMGDIDAIARCHTKECTEHFSGDSVNDAVLAWTAHVAEKHREDWDDPAPDAPWRIDGRRVWPG